MSRRTIGLTVVLTVIGVAFVLEGWTFMDLIIMQFTDQDTERPVQSTSPGSGDRVAPGDTIELDPECTVNVESMSVHAGSAAWTFRITVTIENSGSDSISVRSRGLKLTSGDMVTLDRTMSVPGNGSVTVSLSAPVPEGTEVTEWHLRWSRSPEAGDGNDRSIPLDKAPVRRRDE